MSNEYLDKLGNLLQENTFYKSDIGIMYVEKMKEGLGARLMSGERFAFSPGSKLSSEMTIIADSKDRVRYLREQANFIEKILKENAEEEKKE
ncbi:MAG: hypothetical protein PVJ67_03330 [Candidatus Pacearchaeota archaeon]|jgi:hypothetical protein